jgi:hypothetical protein
MKTPEVPPPALCDEPLIETPRSATGGVSSTVSFKARSDVLSMDTEFIPRIKQRHLARCNATFEFPFHKP